MNKVLGFLICTDHDCAERLSEVCRTEEQSVKLPDGTKIVTEESEPFLQSLALREVTAIENNIATLSCGHKRFMPIMKMSAQEEIFEGRKHGVE
jgi:hypothetical protein